MSTWSDPKPLSAYKGEVRKPGVYVIGSARDPAKLPAASNAHDPYLLENWPDNFKPEYVGISEVNVPGVRGRLSCHARRKGNKHIADLIGRNTPLFFIVIYGQEATKYEALLLCLKTAIQFKGNERAEHDRAAKKQYDAIRARMSDYERSYYDNLDTEGSGM
jgi:hypothetical protein